MAPVHQQDLFNIGWKFDPLQDLADGRLTGKLQLELLLFRGGKLRKITQQMNINNH